MIDKNRLGKGYPRQWAEHIFGSNIVKRRGYVLSGLRFAEATSTVRVHYGGEVFAFFTTML